MIRTISTLTFSLGLLSGMQHVAAAATPAIACNILRRAGERRAKRIA